MKLNFLPNMNRFMENLGREFGSAFVGEISVTLPPKLYDYAWREVAQFEPTATTNGPGPRKVEWWHCGIKATLKKGKRMPDNG